MEPLLEDSARDWFAAQVWAGHEHSCADHLRMRGYEVFLPCYREIRRWSDRVKKVDCALFTGYVFCRAQGGVAGKIVTTPRVIRMVGDGRHPLAIPLAEIEALQRIMASGATTEPWQFVRSGHKVRIEVGPLRGIEGIVLETRSRHRLIVSISLLSRSVAVEIDADWVTVRGGAIAQDDVRRASP